MAGLMDFLNSDEARMGLGLLGAAGPQTDIEKTGLGYAMQQGMASVDAYKKQQMANMLAQSQAYENMGKAQTAQATAQAAARKQAGLGAAFASGKFDPYTLVQAGYTPEEALKVGTFGEIGKPKVARTVTGMENGQPVTYQVDDYGNRIGEAIPEWKAPIVVKQGDRDTVVGQGGAGPVINSFGVNESPDAKLQSETQQRGQDMTANTAVWKTQQEAIQKAAEANAKGLNDVQSKSLLFGARMQDSNKTLEDLEKRGWTKSIPGSNAGWGVGAGVSALQPEELQSLDNAKRNFLTAVLRRESGAVISPVEMEEGNKTYFPQVNEGPAIIAQKKRARELATAGILTEVPDAQKRISSITSQLTPMPTPGAAPAPAAPRNSQMANENQASKIFSLPGGGSTAGKRAADGHYYAPDPTRPGKFIKLD